MATPLSRTSVTLDEAVFILLGLADGPIEFSSRNEYLTEEEQDVLDSEVFCLREWLHEEKDWLTGQYHETTFNEEVAHEIEKRRDAVARHDEVIKQANSYLAAINDELNKGEALSALHRDTAMSNAADTFITLVSLDEWAKVKYKGRYKCSIFDDAKPLAQENEDALPPSDIKTSTAADATPWSIVDPADPIALQSWYTAARYFARHLVKDDPTLLTKREVLAKKVVQSLTGVGIYKRGGKLPLDPSTIKKALVNMILK